jgi:tetratricopeptide (TPR) repeat protein
MDSPSDLIPNRVKGYRLLGGKVANSEFVDVSSRFAGGGTRSSVIDLLKYAQGIMVGKLLKPETWRTMFTSMSTQGGWLTGYGMGWRVGPLKGHFQVNHSGSQPETRTSLLILPFEKFAVAVGVNLERADLTPYVQRLAELVLDEDLDSTAYLPNPWEQALFNAVWQTYSYGLSQFLFQGKATARNIQEQKAAFEYFNKTLDPSAIKKDPETTRKRLTAGIQPAAGEPFTKVGSYMAWKLTQVHGEARLRVYHRDPLIFFSDYLKIADNPYPLNRDISQLLNDWRKDWERTYTSDLRKIHITADADIAELGTQLKRSFPGARIYPDFSRELRRVALFFLDQRDFRNGLGLLELSTDLYPQDTLSWFSRAAGHFWMGDVERAQVLLRKAHQLSPDIMDEINALASDLWGAKRINELISLAEVVLELYPRNAGQRVELARVYLSLGDKENAIKYLREALKINPRLKEVEAQLSELEKK